MKWLSNLKVKVKLLAGFGLIAIFAGMVGFIGVTNLQSVNVNYTQLFNNYGKPLGDIGRAAFYFEKIRCYIRDLAIYNDSANRQKAIDGMQLCDKKMNEFLATYESTIQTAKNQSSFKELTETINQFEDIRETLAKYALSDNRQQYLAVMQDPLTVRVITRIENLINELLEGKIANGNLKSAEYTRMTEQTINTMLVIVIVALLLAAGLGILIAGTINKPVKELVRVAEKIATGDLDVNLEVKSTDELGTLMKAFDKMARNTNEVLTNIDNASEQVAAGAKQVSISSQALSQGSTEQAGSLEEITASITEIAAQTKQNASHANRANEMAMTAKDSAIEGNQQMKGMLKAMDEINDSSASISKIIKVIDEIAFQTNILALNAAVEAARAGQHGKGFAVVAEEVRNLAARSANAAKETTALIEGSIKKVDVGTKIANETAQALNKIVENVSGATNLVAEIASASNQQASAIAQINQGIEQVSQVTQSNTATSEESASASEELSSQAELLRSMVGRFKIKRSPQVIPQQLKTIHPEILSYLEDMIKNKNLYDPASPHAQRAFDEVAARSKININLDDSNFGKY